MNKYAVLLFAIGFSLTSYILFQGEHTFRPVDGEIVSLQLLEQSKAGVSDSPFRYRVLTPWLMAGVTDVGGYALVEMALITVLLVSVFVAGEQWRRDGTTAVLIVAMLLAFSHEWQIYSTSRYIEGILVAWALIMLRSNIEPYMFWENFNRAYRVKDKAGVTAFIKQRPYLMPLIAEISRTLPKYFQECGYVVEVEGDYLAISILPDEMSLYNYDLSAFDNDWWIKNVHRARGNIVITLD